MERVRAAAERVKEVLAVQAFEHGGALLDEYGRAVETALEGASPAGRRAAAEESLQLLAELRRLALARRAHLAARLDELRRAGAYLEAAPRPRWRMEG